MTGDISYDLIMEDDMGFVEGCYRLEKGSWQVVVVSKQQVEKPKILPGSWESGVTGVEIHIPSSMKLNRGVVEQLLSEWFNVDKWNEVRGPDSLQLR